MLAPTSRNERTWRREREAEDRAELAERQRAMKGAPEEEAATAAREDVDIRSYGLSAASANELAESKRDRELRLMAAEPDPYELNRL